MKFIYDIKSKIGQFALRRYFISLKRTPVVNNLDQAKSVGLIFDADTEKDFDLAVNYLKLIKEEFGIRNVRAFGYFSEKQELPHLKRSLQVDYFTRKDLNWFNRPEGKFINDFGKEKFDVLIDLSENDSLPLQYLVAMSPARFKIGRFSDENLEFYDMMVDVKGKSLSYFIEQATTYLTLINQKQAV